MSHPTLNTAKRKRASKELTFKQRVRRRCKTAYCARHADMPDMWCVFLRRDDMFAKACAFKINDAWRYAARAINA